MRKLKNSVVGFVVSFVGSIPLGYLNLIGYQIFASAGIKNALLYLSGIVLVEGVVIYFTLHFATVLTSQKKWMKYIDLFSILFLFALAGSFFIKGSSSEADSFYISYPPFYTGLILSSLNFVQIPFWTGWNLYLVNNNYISTYKPNNYFYVVGTLFGTFSGMLSLILGLHYFSTLNSFLNQNFIAKAIPIVFLGLAVFQSIQFYRKYYIVKS